jgi:hypothetical protein
VAVDRARLLEVINRWAAEAGKGAGRPKRGQRKRTLSLDARRFQAEIAEQLRRIETSHRHAARRISRSLKRNAQDKAVDLSALEDDRRDALKSSVNMSFRPGNARRKALDLLLRPSILKPSLVAFV